MATNSILDSKYETYKMLGAGGTATVYKARHREYNHIRAVRIIHGHIDDLNSERAKSFRDEVRVLLRLGNGHNAHTIRAFSSEIIGNQPIIELEFINGKDLDDLISTWSGKTRRTICLEVPVVIQILRDMASALAYIHQELPFYCLDPDTDGTLSDAQIIEKYRIIHNDIHTKNIMQRTTGEFVLLDFGLSLDGKNNTPRTSKRGLGVEEFMAPEKFDDDALTEEADIYGLGVVLYECLTGEVPFPAKTADKNSDGRSMQWRHANLPVPPIWEKRRAKLLEMGRPEHSLRQKDFPDWLEDSIMTCLEKEPTRRYKNGFALKKAVEQRISSIQAAPDEERLRRSVEEEVEHRQKADKAEIWRLGQEIKALRGQQQKDDTQKKSLGEEIRMKQVSFELEAKKNADLARQVEEMKATTTRLKKETDRLADQLKNRPAAVPIYATTDNELVKQANRRTIVVGLLTALVGAAIGWGSQTGQIGKLFNDSGRKSFFSSPISSDSTAGTGDRDSDPDLETMVQKGIELYNQGKYSDALSYFEEAADQGNATAQYYLGDMYRDGTGLPQNYSLAVSWYRKAAEQGNATAQNNLGYRYEFGQGVSIDYAEALDWYRKAAEQGYATAQNNLGNMYYEGKGLIKDYEQAASWYQKAAGQGHTEAQNTLGNMYYYGYGVTKDYEQAAGWYRKAAELGHAEAQNNLGYVYANGNGVTKDDEQAVSWYRKAAEQGHATAQNNLGNMYYNGNGISKDYEQAVNWYRKSAEQKYPAAQNNLGNMYYNGRGVTKDYDQAISWYNKSANQGYSWAQYNLGSIYQNGNGVTQDYKQAVGWYSKAADQDNSWAQNNLGAMYYYGQGVSRDYEQAAYWFVKAADQGYAISQSWLGVLYEEGNGVSQNQILAISWYIKAARQGDATAQKALKRLNEKW